MYNYNNIQIIIMAGGVGSRFWPMSTPDYPKQFIDVMGVGRSLIQLTVDRLKPICPVENMWVVTNEKYIRIVKEQIPDMPVDNILSEPEARNTAPCIAYACWKIQKQHPDANIVVTPSDALVINTSEYQRVLSKALSYTSDKNTIVTIGIKPSRPETGYGYIASAEPTSVDEIYKVEASRKSQTWKQPSNILLPAITIGMPESSYGTLIPSARQSEPSSQILPASWMRWHLLSIPNRRKR